MRKSPFTLLSLVAGACMVLVSGVALGQPDEPERRSVGPAARQADTDEADDVNRALPADRRDDTRDGAVDAGDPDQVDSNRANAERDDARVRRGEERDVERGDVRVERERRDSYETRRVSPEDERFRRQEIAWLGVYLDPRYSNHAVVEAVHVGSPADEAGVQAGDWILSVNDIEINSPAHLSRLIGSMEPGEEIDLGVSQRVERRRNVQLAERPVVRDRFRFDAQRRETLETTTERDQIDGRFDRDRTRIDARRDRDRFDERRFEEGRFEDRRFEGERRESLRVDPQQEDAPRRAPMLDDDSDDGDSDDGDSGDGAAISPALEEDGDADDGNDGNGASERPLLDDNDDNDDDKSNVDFTPSGEQVER